MLSKPQHSATQTWTHSPMEMDLIQRMQTQMDRACKPHKKYSVLRPNILNHQSVTCVNFWGCCGGQPPFSQCPTHVHVNVPSTDRIYYFSVRVLRLAPVLVDAGERSVSRDGIDINIAALPKSRTSLQLHTDVSESIFASLEKAFLVRVA